MYAICLCVVLALFAVSDAKEDPTSTPPDRTPDCSLVRCAWPQCGPGYHAVTLEGNCCPSCEQCPRRLLPCPLLVCDFITYSEGEPCGCPVCTLVTEETDPPATTATTDPPATTATTDLPKTTVTEETPTPIVDPPECEISGQVWTECGTACPPVCGEKRPNFCSFICVVGCQCLPGTLLDRDSAQCVTECSTTATTDPPTTPEIDDPVCSLEPDRGLCRARMRRFFYNATSGRCEVFAYGGCGGNDNNFMTITDCQTACSDTTATPSNPTDTASTTPHTRPSSGTSSPPPTRPSTGNTSSTTPTKPATDGTGSTPPHTRPSTGGTSPPPHTTRPSTGGTSPPPTRPSTGGTSPPPTRPSTGGTSPPPTRPSTGGTSPPPTKPSTGGTSPPHTRPLTGGTSPPPHTKPSTGTPSRKPSTIPPTKPTESELTETPPSKTPPSTAETGITPTPLDPCTLRKDQGPCTTWMRRYYYNATRNRCKPFRYGGCGGNLNRFDSYEDCASACMCKFPQPWQEWSCNSFYFTAGLKKRIMETM